MKKKQPCPTNLTLWNAANVLGHGNFDTWWNDYHIKRRVLTDNKEKRSINELCGLTTDDFPLLQNNTDTSQEKYVPIKKAKIVGEKQKQDKIMSVYTVGIRPTVNQRQVLNKMLKLSNTVFNWCDWLVRHHGVKPRHFELQSYVTKQKLTDVKNSLVCPEAEWIFRGVPMGMTAIQNTAAKMYAINHKTAQTMRWKSKDKRGVIGLKPRDAIDPDTGSIGVQKQYIRKIKANDIIHASTPELRKQILDRSLSILPRAFGKKTNPRECFLMLTKPTSKLPPIDHDCTISKRSGNKWVLNIPCDPRYVRVPTKTSEAMCGIDPGARAFLTIFDESRHEADRKSVV